MLVSFRAFWSKNQHLHERYRLTQSVLVMLLYHDGAVATCYTVIDDSIFQWRFSRTFFLAAVYRIFAHILRGLCTFLHAIKGCAGYTWVRAIQNHFYTILCTKSADSHKSILFY